MVRIPIDTRTERNILYWILRELRTVYGDAGVWGRLTRSGYVAGASSGGRLLEEALRERVYRVAGWALDALVLLDTEGLVTWGRRDLDVHVYTSRLDTIEILESLGGHRIGSLVVPLLKFESWDSIARQGGSRFKRWRGQTGNGLEHFAHSENRWVVLCALYALYQTVPTSRFVREESGTLERLCSDSYRYVAQTAAALRDFETGGLSHVHTFELLETVLFLKQTPLFGTLPGEKLMPVAEICEIQTYEKDTVISREGEISDNLYIVKSGTIEIVKTLAGTKKVLALLHPNMTYGEIGMFSQSQRSATAIAMEDCCVYEIQRSALKKAASKNAGSRA